VTTTVTATAEPTATPPRVRLDLTTNKTSLTVYRVALDGTKTPVRTYDGGPLPVSGSTALLYDPEAFFGQPYTYTTDDTATTASASVTVNSDVPWLVHPGVPTRSMPVEIADMSDRQAPANQSVRYPLNRRFPIVANDGQRKADSYTLTLRTTGQVELEALQELLDDLSVLLLNVPADPTWVDLSSEYVAVGDLARANPGRYVQFDKRLWSLPCSVTDRPAGGSQAFNTYAKSTALYATYSARLAAHATYGAAFDA
jgi:hypothetical protein